MMILLLGWSLSILFSAQLVRSGGLGIPPLKSVSGGVKSLPRDILDSVEELLAGTMACAENQKNSVLEYYYYF